MQSGNNQQIAIILKQYKLKNGAVNYPMVFNIPSTERLPVLYERDFMQATALVVGAITVAFEKMNLKNMTGAIVNDIAETILDSCGEDNLSLEDLMLFLQKLVRGLYGNIEQLSVARFMNIFEQYRQERHEAILNYREENHVTLKKLGDNGRSAQSDPLSEHFATFGDRISQLKDDLKYANNRHLKDIDNF